LAGYQYETSPRKIKPEYRTTSQKTKKTTTKKANNSNSKAKKAADEKKKKLQHYKSIRRQIIVNAMFIFAVLIGMMYQNVKINETFAKIQSLKSQATEIQKENDQLEISIQNELNLNNIEESAKTLLGMQKLTSSQTRYVNLSKKDYVEASTEKIIIEENENLIQKIINAVTDLFF
jgi:cell division protein FtsL